MIYKQSVGTLISSSAKKLQKENVVLRDKLQKANTKIDHLEKCMNDILIESNSVLVALPNDATAGQYFKELRKRIDKYFV